MLQPGKRPNAPVDGFEFEKPGEVLIAMASPMCSTPQERLLLREITHRINNEFASAIQVVSFTAARSPDRNVKAALSGVMEQLHNYARVHHALQMPANNDCIDASAYLRDLCQSISRSKLENRNIELVFVEHPLWMSSERCWMMGMIVAELITNAVRHAFDRQGGAIRIECRTSGEFVECRVSDNGAASTADVRPGSGLRIIEALSQSLGADFQFNCGEGGSESVGAVAELVGIEGGVVSGVINLESSGVEASDWRPRHDEQYYEA